MTKRTDQDYREPDKKAEEVNASYETFDLFEAAFLMAKDFPFKGAKTGEDGMVSVQFGGYFPRNAIMDYWNGGQVEAKKMAEAYNSLKAKVFTVKKQGYQDES